MIKYKYKAKRSNNKVVTGFCYANNSKELEKRLLDENLYLISKKIYKNKKFISDRITDYDLSMFCNKMEVLLKSGLELIKALKIIKNSIENNRLKDIIVEGINDLEEGLMFCNTLEKYKEIPSFMISTIKVGEESGSLQKSFNLLSKYYTKNKANKRKLQNAITYPLTVLVLGICVFIYLVLNVVPIFNNIFKSFESEVPLITKIVINISNHLSHYYNIYLTILIILVIIFFIIKVNKKSNILLERIKIKNFIFKKIYSIFYSNILVNGLLILHESGQTLSKGVEYMSKLLGNKYLEKQLDYAVKNIKAGKDIATSLEEINVFDEILIDMIRISEESGKVKEILNSLKEYYEEEYDYKIQKLIKKIEPIMILFIGGIVLTIILSIFIPMFAIMGSIGK